MTIAELTEQISSLIRREDSKDAGLPRRLREAQQRLAVAFGERYGWEPSEQSFALSALGPQRDRVYPSSWWDIPGGHRPEYIDHLVYYREKQRPYRPAAIAAHNYERGKTSAESRLPTASAPRSRRSVIFRVSTTRARPSWSSTGGEPNSRTAARPRGPKQPKKSQSAN
jgi:hypothetical protein